MHKKTHCGPLLWLLFSATMMFLSGCQSTQSGSGYSGGVGPSAVGPGPAPLGDTNRRYSYNKAVYLDLAIPMFDPGFPMKNGDIDYEQVKEDNIWPEVRRFEAKRFAVNTRNAILKTQAFGSVSVAPDPSVMADLYLLGRINQSDTRTTKLGIKLIDATQKTWGEKDFKVTVSSAQMRDKKNEGQDPNARLWRDIADWVFKQVQKRKAKELENIKLVGDVRYAAYYSPEAFGGYLSAKRPHKLTGMPADSDRLLSRVREYRAKDQAFVDDLQVTYDEFYTQTTEDYRTYQKETLPILEDYAKKRRETWTKIIFAVGIIAAKKLLEGELNIKDYGPEVEALYDILAWGSSVKLLYDAYQLNQEAKESLKVFDEQGQSLDTQISPQLRDFEGKEVELTGTAAEQYEQWRAHLLQIYKATETPDRML